MRKTRSAASGVPRRVTAASNVPVRYAWYHSATASKVATLECPDACAIVSPAVAPSARRWRLSRIGKTQKSLAPVRRLSINQKMETRDRAGAADLIAAAPRIVNVGLELFAVNLAQQGAKVVHVAWTPPAGGDARLADLLDKLRG